MRQCGLVVTSLGTLTLLAGCGSGQTGADSVSIIRDAQVHVRFHIHVPHKVPAGFTFEWVDQPVTTHGYQAIAIAYTNPELFINVLEYGRGLSPSMPDPQTGTVRAAGRIWKVYGEVPALVRTFPDGVTIEIDGGAGARRSDLLVLAGGLR